jgi:hypothetical protein
LCYFYPLGYNKLHVNNYIFRFSFHDNKTRNSYTILQFPLDKLKSLCFLNNSLSESNYKPGDKSCTRKGPGSVYRLNGQRFPELRRYLIFRLNRIPLYPRFGLDRFSLYSNKLQKCHLLLKKLLICYPLMCLHFPFIHCRLLICFEIESAHISLSVNLQAWEMLSAKNKSQLSCHNFSLYSNKLQKWHLLLKKLLICHPLMWKDSDVWFVTTDKCCNL